MKSHAEAEHMKQLKTEPMRLKGMSGMESYQLFPKLEAPLMSLEEFSLDITG